MTAPYRVMLERKVRGLKTSDTEMVLLLVHNSLAELSFYCSTPTVLPLFFLLPGVCVLLGACGQRAARDRHRMGARDALGCDGGGVAQDGLRKP